jgi:hypothetical protein
LLALGLQGGQVAPAAWCLLAVVVAVAVVAVAVVAVADAAAAAALSWRSHNCAC